MPVYSFDWLRPIRPAQALLALTEALRGRPPSRDLRRIAAAADLLGARIFKRYMPDLSVSYCLDRLEPGLAVEMIARAPGLELRPWYDSASLGWLLDMCRLSGVADGFRAAAVRGTRHAGPRRLSPRQFERRPLSRQDSIAVAAAVSLGIDGRNS